MRRVFESLWTTKVGATVSATIAVAAATARLSAGPPAARNPDGNMMVYSVFGEAAAVRSMSSVGCTKAADDVASVCAVNVGVPEIVAAPEDVETATEPRDAIDGSAISSLNVTRIVSESENSANATGEALSVANAKVWLMIVPREFWYATVDVDGFVYVISGVEVSRPRAASPPKVRVACCEERLSTTFVANTVALAWARWASSWFLLL